jgi:hypothetical protein
MNQGLLTSIFSWFQHPLSSEGTIGDWLAGLVLVLILAFLWTQVVRQID